MPVQAVIFDLDGVLVDSEQVWDAVREEYTREAGGTWRPGATRAMMGMSSREWSGYMHDELGVPAEPERISTAVAGRVEDRYRARLPLLPGAQAAVRRLAARWRLAIASSSNRPVIELVLELSALGERIAVVVSSEEVAHGKPAPDVYLTAAARLGVPAASCAAVEDSTNGLRAAHAAGMRVIAVPNRTFPPEPEALASADVVLESLERLGPGDVDPTL